MGKPHPVTEEAGLVSPLPGPRSTALAWWPLCFSACVYYYLFFSHKLTPPSPTCLGYPQLAETLGEMDTVRGQRLTVRGAIWN